MNEYLIQKLKEGRASVGLKQSEVAEKIGIKGNTLSNYENGVSEPDIDTFCILCDIYNLDPSEILGEAYGLGVQGNDFSIKPSEIDYIKSFRSLDDQGREHIITVLDWETNRIESLASQTARIAELEVLEKQQEKAKKTAMLFDKEEKSLFSEAPEVTEMIKARFPNNNTG